VTTPEGVLCVEKKKPDDALELLAFFHVRELAVVLISAW
jgi:hypothetical protein